MNRTHHQEVKISGSDVYVTQTPLTQSPGPSPRKLRRPPSESDAIDDRTHQRILTCLQKLTKTEVMFVISQMQFGNYMNKPAYAAAASMLPKPGDLAQDKRMGDFDILIIHRKHGILAGEIKAVGSKFSTLLMTEQKKDDSLVERVERAIKQMQKAREVLGHLVSKDERQPMIKTTLMLPNIERTQLHRVLANREQLFKVDSNTVFIHCSSCCCTGMLLHNAMFRFETVTELCDSCGFSSFVWLSLCEHFQCLLQIENADCVFVVSR